MADVKKFRVRGKGFLAGVREDMELEGSKLVMCSEVKSCGYVSQVFDSAETGTQWGRMILEGSISEESEYVVYALAQDHDLICYDAKNLPIGDFLADEKISFVEKLSVLKAAGAQVSNNVSDILMHNQEGQYFVFALQFFSHLPVSVFEVSLLYPKETLMQYLPEIYNTESGDFLSRYMAIFGSLLYDKKELLAKLPDYLNLDKTPDDVLPILADWLGINCDVGFLEPEKVRKILRLAKDINGYKGTKQVLEDVAEIYLGERPMVVEQFKWRKYGGVEQQEECLELYGKQSNEFTILLKNAVDEQTFLHFKGLIETMTPIKTKARIICLERESQFDCYTYLDLNAQLVSKPAGLLNDTDQRFDSEFALA